MPGPPTQTASPAAIDVMTMYLTGACGPSGQFAYRVNLDPAVRVSPKYNVLRHAGAVYALALAVPRDPDPGRFDALRRSASFLLERCVEPMLGDTDMMAVWSDPELNHSGRPRQVKLGGLGLGLVALLATERVLPGTVDPKLGPALGRAIEFMQKDNGSFYSKFKPDRGGRRDQWTSLYYPGEAALGLAMLFQHTGDVRWLACAARALGYLARLRADELVLPADHWALLATERVLAHADGHELPVTRDELVRHGLQITDSIMRGQVWQSADPEFVGGFAADGRTTPTSTRLEGLIAAAGFLGSTDSDLASRLRASIDAGVAFLLPAIVRNGPHAGGVPRALHRLSDDDPRNAPSFNRRAMEVRIDYVQHALCAMMQYEALFGRLPE